MFDLSKSSSPPSNLPGLPLRLFRGSSSRLCLVLSDIDHSNSLRSSPPFYPASSSVSATLPSSGALSLSHGTVCSLFSCHRDQCHRRNVDSCFAIHPTTLASSVTCRRDASSDVAACPSRIVQRCPRWTLPYRS